MTEVRTFRAATVEEALEIVRREFGAEAVILQTRYRRQRRLLPWRRRERVEVTAAIGLRVRPLPKPDRMPRSCAEIDGRPASDLPDTWRRFGKAGEVDLLWDEPEGCAPGWEKPEIVAERTSRDAADAATKTLTERLDSLERMLRNLTHDRGAGHAVDVPPELFELFTELIEADVADELARDLIYRLRRHASAEQLADTTATRALLTGIVESDIRAGQPITPVPGRRKVVALVGPTGVGKTTTIAKLAANFRLRDRAKMGLVTVDTYRIAAVEQLRTYAEIIDLPMQVVTSSLEMRRALDTLSGLDLVLIDTAGRSPRDEMKIQELKSLLSEADVDEVHLVLSLTASPRSLQSTAKQFAAVGTTSLILTKLDETPTMGTLLEVARTIPLPVSYLTTGQDVPDDIEPACAERMARLILGQDRLLV